MQLVKRVLWLPASVSMLAKEVDRIAHGSHILVNRHNITLCDDEHETEAGSVLDLLETIAGGCSVIKSHV